MKKHLVWLLALTLVLTLALPLGARAETPPATATVTIRSQAEGQYLHRFAKPVKVAADLAESYGYTDSVTDGVSALDALVKAHELKYGGAFTKKTAQNYLVVPESGFVSKLFGVETTSNSFSLNQGYPNDGTESPYGGGYNGTFVTSQKIVDGDILDFFFYEDPSWCDYYTWVDLSKSSDGTATVTVTGIMYMAGYMYKTPEDLRAAAEPLEVGLGWVDPETGTVTPIDNVLTDGTTGQATITIPENETRMLVALSATGHEDSWDDVYTIMNPTPVAAGDAVPPVPAAPSGLIVHTGSTPDEENTLLGSDAHPFDPNTLTYTLPSVQDTTTTLRFRAAAGEGEKVTLRYGEKAKDLSDSASKSVSVSNCLHAGRNTLSVEVTPAEGSAKEAVTYTLIIDCVPTLKSLSSDIGFWNAPFEVNTKEYTLTIPASTETLSLTAAAKSSGVQITFNGSENSNVSITGVDTVEVKLTAGEVTNVYTLHLKKAQDKTVSFAVTPEDAVVRVYDPKGTSLTPNADGSYTGLFADSEYTYTVVKTGYVAQTGTVPAEGGKITVTLEKATAAALPEVDAWWPSFRGNPANLGITQTLLPTNPDTASLKWAKRMSADYEGAPSVQIIADDALIVMCGTNLIKLDLATGEELAKAEMVAAPSYGYTPPTYAAGMIFCPLGGGTVQAFNADTLESLWVYTDPLKGQAQSPITYSDGYIYTGFWNAEAKDGNFVCLSVTDEDPAQTNEAKAAAWRHTQPGGFYWAGSIVIGDTVIVGTDDGAAGSKGDSHVYAFSKADGTLRSELTLTGAGDQRSAIVNVDGRLYFTTKGGYLCSAKFADGILSDLKMEHSCFASTSTPIVYKGKVYYGASVPEGTKKVGKVVVADAESLKTLYTVDMPAYPQCSLLMTTAYEASTGYLYLYSTYNKTPGGITMIRIDPTKDTADGAQAVELYNAEGYEQFCICSLICGPDGTLYYKNDSGAVFAVSAPQEEGVILLIDAIGTVTEDSEEKIAAARAAYDALPDTAKAKVTNYDVLTAAEAALAALKQEKADQAAAAAVTEKIAAIGTVTESSEEAIAAARAAYDALSDAAKAKVTNYDVLTAAEAALAALKQEKADQAAAAAVTEKIAAIGTVTKDSGAAIQAARKAYDALTDAQKALVTNYDVLTAAEKAFAATQGSSAPTGDPMMVLPALALLLLSAGGLILLGKKRIF